MSAALKFMIISLQNLMTTSHRKSDKSKCDCNLTEFDVVTKRIWYSQRGL